MHDPGDAHFATETIDNQVAQQAVRKYCSQTRRSPSDKLAEIGDCSSAQHEVHHAQGAEPQPLELKLQQIATAHSARAWSMRAAIAGVASDRRSTASKAVLGTTSTGNCRRSAGTLPASDRRSPRSESRRMSITGQRSISRKQLAKVTACPRSCSVRATTQAWLNMGVTPA